VLLYPLRTGRLARPYVQVPGEQVAFLFTILRNSVPPDAAAAERQLQDNRMLYERDGGGGKRYPVGSVPFTPADWRDHFGANWPAFAAAEALRPEARAHPRAADLHPRTAPCMIDQR